MILLLTFPTDTHAQALTKSVTRLCESPASVKSCKHMRTVLNSFPILWSIWNGPSTPLFLLRWPSLCPHCQWHNLKFSTLHHLLHRPPRPFYPFMSPDLIRLPLSKPFCPVPFTAPPFSPPSPSLSSALYTLVCWHVLCLSSL